MKKALSIIVCLYIVLSVFTIAPFSVSAAESDITETGATSGTTGDCTWTLNGTELTISGNGAMDNYGSSSTLPWGKSITKVTIAEGVTSIGNYAFYGCTGLRSVTISDSVTSIGNCAFDGCTSLTSVTIPDSVTSIGKYAFSSCKALANIMVNTDNAFFDSRNNCNAIIITSTNTLLFGCKNTVIPDSVTSIGEFSFHGCTDLMSITIPDSVTSIDSSAFQDCTGLSSVTIGKSVKSIGFYAFSGCSSLTNVTIPDSVTSIDNGAFYHCTGLTSVSIPDSVTSIGICAFESCYGLTSVTIPDSVTSIGSSAFSGCTGLINVTIGNSVTSIFSEAFRDCTKLSSVTIGNSVTGIGGDAFYNTAWYNNQPDGLVYAGKVAYKMKGSCPSDVVIKDGTVGITDHAFSSCTNLTSVTIPDSVTSIGNKAFYGCTKLSSMTIGNSVADIGSEAFYNTAWYNNQPDGLVYAGKVAYKMKGTCPSDVNIKDGTLSITSEAFYKCTSLNSVTIPDSVTSIGNDAFFRCTNLTSITIPDSVTSINFETFHGCVKLTNLAIGNSVKSIGDLAFNKCTSLTSITIPDSVTSIGRSAFYHCTGLTSVTIPESVTSIGQSAFSGCNSSCTIYGKKGSVAEVYAISNGISFKAFLGNCNNCHKNITDNNVDLRIDATCTESGTAYWHCDNCGEVGEFELPALGHDYNSVVTSPTCTKGGYTTYTCSRCKDSYESDYTSALNHNYKVTVTPPTCSAEGFTTHTCSRCNDTYVTDKVNALGHDYQQTGVTPPSCTEGGYTTYKCSRCGGNTIDNRVDALGHDYQQTNVISPSCTEGGYTTYKCSRCGDDQTDNFVNALGHDCNITVKKDPTATQQGLMVSECIRCGIKKNVVLPVLSEEGYTLTKSSEPGKVTYTLKDKTYGIYKIVANAPEGWYASGASGDCAWIKEGTVLTIYNNADPSILLSGNMENYSNTNPAPWKDSNITKVIIKDGVRRIGSYAFSGCTALTTAYISDSVEGIGYGAFYNCQNLTDVKLPNSAWTIPTSAFNGCSNLKSIAIPSSVHQIDLFAFARTGLTSVTLPESVSTFEDCVFYDCSDMKSITILNPNLYFQVNQGNATQKGIGWYYDYSKGSDQKIPGFTIYGYGGSSAERLANNSGFNFVKIGNKTDSTTGIEAVIPDKYNLRVNELTGQDAANAAENLPDRSKAKKVYDVCVTETISVVTPGSTAQLVVNHPGNNMQVKIPCTDRDTIVYCKESDGTFTNMNAEYSNGYLIIYTESTGVFVMAEPFKTLLGDIDGDMEVTITDATFIQRKLADIEIPYDIPDALADANEDGTVDITDVTYIQRWLCEMLPDSNIGKQIAS